MRNARVPRKWMYTPEYANSPQQNRMAQAQSTHSKTIQDSDPGRWSATNKVLAIDGNLPATELRYKHLAVKCCLYMSTAWISMCFSWVLGSFKLQFNSTQKYQHPKRKRMKNTCHRWSCDLAEFQTSTSYVRPPGEPSWAIHEVRWGDTLLASS